MTTDNRQGGAGLFTGGLAGLGGGQTGVGQLSPYLNIDPSYLSVSQPEYIFDTEAKRGSFEKSFTAIGSSVCTGSATGAVYGLYSGNRTWSVNLSLALHYQGSGRLPWLTSPASSAGLRS